MKMKMTVAFLVLVFSSAAYADHLDVIEFKLNEGCTLEKHLETVRDFNAQWGAKYGYKAEVLVPIQSNNLTSLFWIGRSKDAASYGKGWDTWRNELRDPNSVASKLWARFQGCSTNLGRRGYDVY